MSDQDPTKSEPMASGPSRCSAPLWDVECKAWDAARKQKVVRYDYRDSGEVIDRGVNFFVLTLEKLGACTKYSCEGHPDGFYVAFHATHALARRIAEAGFFRVEIERGFSDMWSIRLPEISRIGRPYTERSKG